jgi:hypothetical protein
MHFFGKLSACAPFLAVAMPLAANVLVSSPIDGSTVTQPVHYSATASTTKCSRGVGSMGIYVDNMLLYVHDGTKLNASLVIAAGKHQTVVEEWDHCGTASYTKLSITVAASAPPPAVALPAFSLPSGAYYSVQSVAISDATPGAAIFFTTDGSIPTPSSIQYTAPITVAATEAINAIAVLSGYTNSSVASAAYTVALPAATPTFSVPSGTYTSEQSVTLYDATPAAAIYYTTNGTAPTVLSLLYTAPIPVGVTETLMAMAIAPGSSGSGMARADYVVNLPPPGPFIPANAIAASELESLPNWKFNHDPGTPGSSIGTMSLVNNPSLSGPAAQFTTSYRDWGGEIYYLSYAKDSVSSNFVYDAQVWIGQGSDIGNLEMDMNQVIANGNTVMYAFQCDGDHGTWDFSHNKGALGASGITWEHSTEPCNPAKWTTNAWHHVQISYSRDEVGNVTFNSVWLDGVEAPIGVTVPSAEALHWAHGDLLTNFQVDGVGAQGSSVLYLGAFTIYRW